MKSYSSHTFRFMMLLCIPFFIYGCGSSNSTPDANSASVSGTVLAGPAAGASVTVKTSAGTVVAGPVTTAADGSYTVAVPAASLASDLIFAASGGTFPDEATTTTGVALATLTAHAAAGSLVAGSHVTIDPSSTIVQKLVAGGRTKAAAEAAFAAAFGYTPDCSVKPAFATISSASTTTQRLAGVRAAAFSQLTMDMGLAPAKQFELIQALADDLSDGVLDGLMSGGSAVITASGTLIPVDIASHFAHALMTFQTSPLNKSKLTPDKIGAPVFSKVDVTPSYKVEYQQVGMMGPAQGKTTFKIKLTNLVGGTNTGKTITITPFMYMATKSHTTPTDATITDNYDGTYSCTVYYVMPSVMNGLSMGVWELKVTIDGTESAYFYPAVAMSMGNTSLTKLSGVTDSMTGMAGLEKRTWFLFNDGLTGITGNHTFKLFLATKETMTNFPAVYTGKVLKNENATEWTVSTVVVEVSTDKSNWVTATENGNGHWTASGLTDLTSGVSGSIYVRLTVNGEQKTTDGTAAGAANGYQTFNVTPAI